MLSWLTDCVEIQIISTFFFYLYTLFHLQASLEKTCEDLKNSVKETADHNSVLNKEILDLNAALDVEKAERQKVWNLHYYIYLWFLYINDVMFLYINDVMFLYINDVMLSVMKLCCYVCQMDDVG